MPDGWYFLLPDDRLTLGDGPPLARLVVPRERILGQVVIVHLYETLGRPPDKEGTAVIGWDGLFDRLKREDETRD